jgi:hypothetical protein
MKRGEFELAPAVRLGAQATGSAVGRGRVRSAPFVRAAPCLLDKFEPHRYGGPTSRRCRSGEKRSRRLHDRQTSPLNFGRIARLGSRSPGNPPSLLTNVRQIGSV